MDRLPYVDEDAAERRQGTARAGVERAHRGARKGGPPRRAESRGRSVASRRTAAPASTGGPGQTVPGFRVAEAEPGRRLTLRGRHRFSQYELTFLLDDDRLRAQTRAAFPGLIGGLYRAAVIGTGGHRVATGRLLRQVARRA